MKTPFPQPLEPSTFTWQPPNPKLYPPSPAFQLISDVAEFARSAPLRWARSTREQLGSSARLQGLSIERWDPKVDVIQILVGPKQVLFTDFAPQGSLVPSSSSFGHIKSARPKSYRGFSCSQCLPIFLVLQYRSLRGFAEVGVFFGCCLQLGLSYVGVSF